MLQTNVFETYLVHAAFDVLPKKGF